MKTVVPILAIAALVTACNNTPKNGIDSFVVSPEVEKHIVTTDTSGLSQFQTWKAQHELSNVKEYNNAVYPAAKRTVKRYIPAEASGNRTATSAAKSTTYNSGAMTSQSSNAAMQKKGWSKAAKDATIGAGAGAVIGAIISKNNRASGAVIGGIIGGGAGYGLGRTMDKKDGRY